MPDIMLRHPREKATRRGAQCNAETLPRGAAGLVGIDIRRNSRSGKTKPAGAAESALRHLRTTQRFVAIKQQSNAA